MCNDDGVVIAHVPNHVMRDVVAPRSGRGVLHNLWCGYAIPSNEQRIADRAIQNWAPRANLHHFMCSLRDSAGAGVTKAGQERTTRGPNKNPRAHGIPFYESRLDSASCSSPVLWNLTVTSLRHRVGPSRGSVGT